MSRLLAGAMLVGAGVVLLWVFITILYYGIFKVIEPNSWILKSEIVMSGFFVVYGISEVVDSIKGGR